MNNTEEKILQIPIEEILPNRFQPRLAFEDNALKDLAASIKQHGIIQPLVLRRIGEKYEIIAGERRYKAAKMAGLLTVPAIISNMDDNQSAEVAIVENIQRKDLTAIEEAKSYQALLDKGYMTQDELAKKMGLSQSAISNKLRLLSLDDSVQEAILNEKISERHARTLLKVSDKEEQKKLLDRIIKERMTVKQLEDEIKNMININGVLDEAPVIDATPTIADIVNNATDINEKQEEVKEVEKVDAKDIFSSPETMPNKFFNFLEDEAVNMGMEDKKIEIQEPVEEEKISTPSDLLNQTDNIEMLDDFFNIKKEETKEDGYVNEVINTVRNLGIQNDNVTVEEMNLPSEYVITIKVKKND